jgi:hypothetical protein
LDSATAIARKRRSLRIKSSARFAVAPREPVPRQFLGLRPRWARGKAFGGSFSTLRHELGRPPGLPRPSGTKAMSAMGFEPTRSDLQWILSPPPEPLGKLTPARYRVVGKGYGHRVNRRLYAHAESAATTLHPVCIPHQFPAHLQVAVSHGFGGG